MATPTVYTPKRLIDPVQLGTASGNLYTVPSGKTTQVMTIILVNDTTTAATGTLWLVPTSGTAGDDNILTKAIDVPNDGTPLILEFDGVFLNTGDSIKGKASIASQVTVHVFGSELE